MLAIRLNSLLAAALPLVVACPSQAEVKLVEGSSPTAEFSTIQAAIDASVDGDVILVQPSPGYDAFEINGKSLTLLFSYQADVVQRGSIIRGLSPEQRVVLRGCSVWLDDSTSACTASAPVLSILDNQGIVWIEDFVAQAEFEATLACTSFGGGDNLLKIEAPELEVSNCEAVYLRNLSVERVGSATSTQPACLEVHQSEVVVHDAEIRAGACFAQGGLGASAVRAVDSRVGFWNSLVRGGIGGPANSSGSIPGGAGGPALQLAGAASVAVVELAADGSLNLIGGLGGGGVAPGVPSEAIVDPAGEATVQFVESYGGRLHTQIENQISAEAWLSPEGFKWLRIYDAPPHAPAFLLFSPDASPAPIQWLSGLDEPLCIDPFDVLIVELQPTDESGFTDLRINDEFDGLLEPSLFILQGATLDPLDFSASLTNPTFLSLLQPLQ